MMAHLSNCVNCAFAKVECARRDALRAGLKGLSVTSVKFICRDRKPMFSVGQRVTVTWPVMYPDAGDYGTDAIDYESWPATVVAERDRKFQILVDDTVSNEGTPIRGYLKNETLYAKVRSWRLRPLDEPDRIVCAQCQGVPDASGAVKGCYAYDDGPYSYRPNQCVASVDTHPQGGDGTAPFMSGAVPKADAKTPSPITPNGA